MEEAVIVGQRNFSIANEKQLNRLPNNFGRPGNFALGYCLRDQRQEAVGRVPAVEKLGKRFLPFCFIGPDDRLVLADCIID